MTTISVFVTLGVGRPVIIDISRDAYVAHLVDAVITKLKLDVTADMVLLRFAPNGAGEPAPVLDAFARLSDAGVLEASRLVIEVIHASSSFGAYLTGDH